MGRTEPSHDQRSRHERIEREVTSWPGVTTRPERFGGVEFCVHGRPIGHVHDGMLADIEFPRAMRDRLVAEGRTGPHHIDPDSTWTTLRIHSDADADAAVGLLRIGYDREVARGAADEQAPAEP